MDLYLVGLAASQCGDLVHVGCQGSRDKRPLRAMRMHVNGTNE